MSRLKLHHERGEFNAAEHADALASLDALLAESQRLREALRLVSIWADDEGARMPVALVAFVREALAGDAE